MYFSKEVKLVKNEYIHFELFKVCFLNLSLKEESMRNILNQIVTELARYIIVIYRQELCTCFVDTGILVWYVFTLGLFKSLLLFWQPRYSKVSCCLMKSSKTDVLISVIPSTFEKRMDLVSSSPK